MVFQPDHCFASMTEATKFLLGRQISDPWKQRWVRHDSGLLAPLDLPRHLYRGEPACYETTIPSEQRCQTFLLKDGGVLSADDRKRLNHLKSALLWQLQHREGYALRKDDALGYLQHYGLPTNIIDFTADLRVAFAFATSSDGSRARIAEVVWPDPDQTTVVYQYWNHPWAERAQRQKAVGILMANGPSDLKAISARSRLGLRWYEFPVSDAERAHFRKDLEALLRLGDDASAGFLRFHITEYVEEFGKLSPALARWLLEDRIPIVPRGFLIKTLDLPDVIVNFRAAEHFPNFRLELEASRSERYWSLEHRDRSFDRMDSWRWPEVGKITADPRTYHPDL